MLRYEVRVQVDIPGIATRQVVVTLDANTLNEAIDLALVQVVKLTPNVARVAPDQTSPIGIA